MPSNFEHVHKLRNEDSNPVQPGPSWPRTGAFRGSVSLAGWNPARLVVRVEPGSTAPVQVEIWRDRVVLAHAGAIISDDHSGPVEFELAIPGSDAELARWLVNGVLQAVGSQGQIRQLLPITAEVIAAAWNWLIDQRLDQMNRQDALSLLRDWMARMPPDQFAPLHQEIDQTVAASSVLAAAAEKMAAITNQSARLSHFALQPGVIARNRVALVGHRDRLFLYEGTNNLIALYRESPADMLLKRRVAGWHDLIRARAQRMRQAGIRFTQIIIPEKSSVVPEDFPFPIPPGTLSLRLLEARLAQDESLSGCYLPLLASLRQYPDRTALLSAIDTHFTPRGSWLVFEALLQKLRLPPGPPLIFDQPVTAEGDLGKAFGDAIFKEELMLPAIDPLARFEPGLRLAESEDPAGGGLNGTRRVWRNSTAATPLRVVAFANSFFERGGDARNMSWWAARWFAEFHFVWSARLDDAYIARVKPDLVIGQATERFLTVVPEC